jgi:hypothetical protein
MVRCLDTVRFKAFTLELVNMLDVLVHLDRHPVPGQPPDLLITSANDRTHMINSKHYSDRALDLRCQDFNRDVLQAFLAELRRDLGTTYTVLWEDAGTPNEHLHLQLAKGHDPL